MIEEAIIKIVQKEDLSYDEAYETMSEIMSGDTSPTQNAAFLAALSTKSTKAETIEEISGCAAAMREKALPVEHDMEVFEIVGTGGDGSQSFNVSTTSAFVLAACGLKVAKHGNRSASSKSGAADCLEALGVNIDIEPERCVELLHDIGICFFFAQKYHTSMKYVGAIRKELGIRTVFNILGPLTNPAKPTYQLLGVYDEALIEPLAHVLTDLGVKQGMVVHGQDGIDEVSVCAPTTACKFSGDSYEMLTIDPRELGIAPCAEDALKGGDPQENARITREILGGAEGPKTDCVVLNSAAGLFAAGAVDEMAEGMRQAREAIASGAAADKLEALITESNR
ncbi:MAG: anthranilate phosphoribosyltransferase [Coriobacteriaceae bacterium]|nr:anthranilate phosphoribosyltransferase [Coriobacteriaceae bacterium]